MDAEGSTTLADASLPGLEHVQESTLNDAYASPPQNDDDPFASHDDEEKAPRLAHSEDSHVHASHSLMDAILQHSQPQPPSSDIASKDSDNPRGKKRARQSSSGPSEGPSGLDFPDEDAAAIALPPISALASAAGELAPSEENPANGLQTMGEMELREEVLRLREQVRIFQNAAVVGGDRERTTSAGPRTGGAHGQIDIEDAAKTLLGFPGGAVAGGEVPLGEAGIHGQAIDEGMAIAPELMEDDGQGGSSGVVDYPVAEQEPQEDEGDMMQSHFMEHHHASHGDELSIGMGMDMDMGMGLDQGGQEGEQPLKKRRRTARKTREESGEDSGVGSSSRKREVEPVPLSEDTGKRIMVKDRTDQLAKALRMIMREEWGIKEEDALPGPDTVGPDWLKGCKHPDSLEYQERIAKRLMDDLAMGVCKTQIPINQQNFESAKAGAQTAFLNFAKRYSYQISDDAKRKQIKSAKRTRRWARKDLKQKKRYKAAVEMHDIPPFILKIDYMSSEDSSEGEDSGYPEGLWSTYAESAGLGKENPQDKVLEIKTPRWRSEELQHMFDRVDEMANQQVAYLKGKGHMTTPLRRFKLEPLREKRPPDDATDAWLYADGIVPPNSERGKPPPKYKSPRPPKPKKVKEPKPPKPRASRKKKAKEEEGAAEADVTYSGVEEMMAEAGNIEEQQAVESMMGEETMHDPSTTADAMQALSHMDMMHHGGDGLGMEGEGGSGQLFQLPLPAEMSGGEGEGLQG